MNQTLTKETCVGATRGPKAPADRKQVSWRRRLDSLPYRLTALRLLMIPPLWVLAILNLPVALGVLLALAVLETLAVQLTRSEIDERIGSIVLRRRDQAQGRGTAGS